MNEFDKTLDEHKNLDEKVFRFKDKFYKQEKLNKNLKKKLGNMQNEHNKYVSRVFSLLERNDQIKEELDQERESH